MTITNLKSSNLFKPLQVGNVLLKNRVAHLPTTRARSTPEHVPTDLQLTYYTDRAVSPGTLLVTEATFVSEGLGLYANIPGIWNEKQVQAWKKITDSVHEAGSFISNQLWSLGRVGDPALLKERGLPLVGPSAIYYNERSQKAAEDAGNHIRALTEEEIHDIIYNQFPNAVKNAIKAGFDIVEIHSANGYLLEQFIQPSSNQRTDKYGGSIENRTRIVLEIIDNLLKEGIDAKKLAIRLSPFNTFQGLLSEKESVHPIASYAYLLSELQRRANDGNELAYISVVENEPTGKANVDFFTQIWQGKILRSFAYSSSTDFTNVVKDVEANDRTIIGFGKHFIANPDLVDRLQNGYELTPFDVSTFYSSSNYGYNTYTSYNHKLDIDVEAEKTHIGKALA
ncbi:NAPDH dehydrogenase [Scheffersomyces amazonensis]|uniref:NAPDH dehydrogenase n=1 Tax=Scheffersomyces amazonensis TaxID=1078765 RepID=UPI00315CB860